MTMLWSILEQTFFNVWLPAGQHLLTEEKKAFVPSAFPSGSANSEQQMSEGDQEFVFQAIAYDNAELLAELLTARPLLANCQDAEGRTPLHHAAIGGHAKCAQILIESGADVDAAAAPRDTVKTPLGLASYMGHCAVIELLAANGADLFYVDSDGHSALQLAQMRGHQAVATQLIGTIERIYAEAEQKNQRLCAACVDGEVGSVLDILSDLGTKSVRKQILNGIFPGEQKSALFLAAENGRAEIVRALLTVQDHSIIFEPSGDTVLHAAIASQNVETVEQILHKFPFLMNAVNEENNLPLHWACRCGNAHVVQSLLGAQYPVEDLKFFAFRQDRANRCFASGNEENSRCEEGYLFVCDLNAADQEGRSAFFLAVMEGHQEVVQLLAKFKLPISNGTSHRREKLKIEEETDILVEHPIWFDMRVNGKTPLMIACANGATEIVRILVEQCHVDVNYCPPTSSDSDNSGGALAEAANNGHLEVLSALFCQGAFDYGNRTLKGMLEDNGGYSNCEMVGLFLQQLAHHDNEHSLNSSRSPRQKKEHDQQQHVPLSDHLPSKGCQLNWQSTGIRELRSEWMVDAVLRLNPQIPRHLSKSLAFHTISRIDLSSNRLCSVPHFLFSHLYSLRSLDLSKNSIQLLELPPDGANWQMPCLDRLCLDENQLEELPKQLFSSLHFPRLCFLSAISNRLRRLPSSVWTAPRLRELHLANNLINELSSAALPQEVRRANHLYRGTGTGGATATRISRQRQHETTDGRSAEMDEDSERRQSRSMAKRRESPSQHQNSSSRRDSKGGAEMGKSQSTDYEEDNSTTPRGEGAATAEVTLLDMDIQRVNIWQEKIHLSNIDEDGPTKNDEASGEETAEKKGNDRGTTTSCSSQLQLLNLAHNKFGRMPTCLACCCPRLAKLDLSSNSLSSLGPVGCLPSALRHFDVSKNQLVRLFGGENPAQLRQKLRLCEAQPKFVIAGGMSEGGGTAVGNVPMPRHSRSRSKSVARSQRSLSVVRKSGGAGGCAEQLQSEQEFLMNSFCCVHKSHCRLEALKTLNLAQNSLEFVDILLPIGGGAMDGGNKTLLSVPVAADDGNVEKQFNWRENSELLKPYVLFPSLTNFDLSQNRIRQLPPTISLLSSLAMLNLANNAELDSLVPELGLLERLWTIGLSGCQLRAEEPTLQAMVHSSRYKTGEVLSQLRQRLENSMPYPMLKLMLLGGSSVGKSTLLQQIRLEETLPKKRGSQGDSWSSRRLSPSTPPTTSSTGRGNKTRLTSQHRPSTTTTSAGALSSIYSVDVFEWVYEPPKVSSSSTAKSTTSSSQHSAETDAFQGPITFRVWDFDGIKQREYQSVQRCFFTRRCLFLLLWKVTDGEIALADLHDFLLAIQSQAPNSYVLIVGTHSDFVRDQPHRFPRDYLSQMDKQIQERFILGADLEKNGLPRVLGSLYISCCSREDIKSLCALIYACATEIRQFSRGGGPTRQRLLAQKVPASFVLLEHIVATMTEEFRAAGKEPIMRFNEFWSFATDHFARMEAQKEQQQQQQDKKKMSTTKSSTVIMHFRGAQDFRQACLFLHENGVICYYDDTSLRDFVFLDPSWLCANLYGILAFAAFRRCSFGSANSASAPPSPFIAVTSLSQMHQNSVIESVELYTALKRAVRQNLTFLLSSGLYRHSAEVLSFNSHFRLFRQCAMNFLRKFELALPFQYGRMSLLASCLPDEYVLRADYPGSKVLVRNKFDKLRIRWNAEKEMAMAFVPRNVTRPMPVKMSPIRNYLQHRRLSRAVASCIDNSNASKVTEGNGLGESDEKSAHLIRILAVDQCKEECLRRLYMMHYIPPGFWARLSTRLLDDERVGHVLTKLFLISRASHVQQQQTVSSPETDQQPLLALSSPEAIVAAFCRALNAGRMVNLAQRSSFKRGASVGEEAECVPEEETSFIVVNSAEEMTEEFAFNSNNKSRDDPSSSGATVVVKCCERGVEATDEQCRGNSGRSGGTKAGEEIGNVLEWMLWRSGVEIRCFGTFVLSLRQFLPLASVSDVNYATHELRRRFEEGQWATLSTATTLEQQNQHVSPLSHMIELLIPKIRVRLHWHDVAWELETDSRMATRLLSLLTGAMDDLLEDAYPQLGTRFILSPQGRPLVDRLIPCDRCAVDAIREEERYWLRENINRNPAGKGGGHSELLPRLAKSTSTKFKNISSPKKANRVPKSKSSTETSLNQSSAKAEDRKAAENDGKNAKGINESRIKAASQPVYLFGIEECILEARRELKNDEELDPTDGTHKEQLQRLECPRHGIVRWSTKNRKIDASTSSSSQILVPDLYKMAPDLLFVDLEHEWAIPSMCIQRGKLIGRGAFGFVFTGKLAFVPPSSPSAFRKMAFDKDGKTVDDAAVVALKQFEPVDPNQNNGDGNSLAMPGASEQAALRAFSLKWQNDELEQVTRAYCTARQELCMLSELRHLHCTSMVAFCPSPMTLLMELAPHGSLNKLLADYRRIGQRLHVDTVQMSCLQIARALEYLHVQQHIIYRDLKSENVLVWRFPNPSAELSDRSGKKHSPRDVLVKLGDYGISRFSHPFGMCKGYGGTEGFMAPEIMRYNGEQEYSERADCFSFGMFIYELLTLKQPYEGQPVQQMKERILEAQRPAVSEKELLFGTNMLDLMIACWEERAERRPSSSQLVEICSAPEFAHLLDVALLRESENGSLCLATASFGTAENWANDEWTFWMPMVEEDNDKGGGRQQKQQQKQEQQGRTTIALLKCNKFGWTEKKLISVQTVQCSPVDGSQQFSPSKKLPNFQQQQNSHQPNVTVPKITVIAQIYDEFVWMGDKLGTLCIFELDEHQLGNSPTPLHRIDTTKMMKESGNQLKADEEEQKNDNVHEPLCHFIPTHNTSSSSSSSSSSSLPLVSIRHIVAFRERRLVIVGLTVAVLLCRWHGRENVPQLVCCIQLNPIPSLGSAAHGTGAHLFSMAVLRSLSDWQLWTGHAAGHIFMHFISSATDRLAFSTSANHYAMAENVDIYQSQQHQQQMKKHQTAVPLARCKVAFLVASNCTKNVAWSALEGDPRLFMWRDSQLQKTLNSAKILPISESLSSMEFQQSPDDGNGTQMQHCCAAVFVTALEVMDLSSGGTDQQKHRNEKDDQAEEEEEQLLVGTNNGVVLIVRGIEMSPISAFRPYCSVERIICCPPPVGQSASSCRILQNELLHSSNKKALTSSQSNEQISPQSASSNADRHSKKRSLLIEKSRSIMLKATGAGPAGTSEIHCERPKMSPSTSTEEGKGQKQMVSELRNAAVSAVDELCETVRSGMRGIFTSSESAEGRGTVTDRRRGEETYFISIGKGYRPLLSRFVSCEEINALSNKHREKNCAIFWRSTREWAIDQQKN